MPASRSGLKTSFLTKPKGRRRQKGFFVNHTKLGTKLYGPVLEMMTDLISETKLETSAFSFSWLANELL